MAGSNFRYEEATAQNYLKDPGNAGALPSAYSGFVPMVSAAAETRTLGAPNFVTQTLVLTLDTDGGDVVVALVAKASTTGYTSATFNDAGDTLVLYGVTVGGTLVWEVISNPATGVSLS